MPQHDRDRGEGVGRDTTPPGGDRLQFDEGQAVAERLDELDDPEAKESFDAVFAEFDDRFADE